MLALYYRLNQCMQQMGSNTKLLGSKNTFPLTVSLLDDQLRFFRLGHLWFNFLGWGCWGSMTGVLLNNITSLCCTHVLLKQN